MPRGIKQRWSEVCCKPARVEDSNKTLGLCDGTAGQSTNCNLRCRRAVDRVAVGVEKQSRIQNCTIVSIAWKRRAHRLQRRHAFDCRTLRRSHAALYEWLRGFLITNPTLASFQLFLAGLLLLIVVLFVRAGLVGWLRDRFPVLRSYIP